MTRKPIITITIPAELLTRLDDLADAKGVARSALIAELVQDGIDQAETTVKALTHPVLGPAMARAFSQPGVLRAMAAVIGQELEPEQLQLFKKAIGQMNEPEPATSPTPRRRPAKSRTKRAKK